MNLYETNSIGAEKIEVAFDVLVNKSDWFESDVEKAEKIVNAFNNNVSVHVIAYMPLNF